MSREEGEKRRRAKAKQRKRKTGRKGRDGMGGKKIGERKGGEREGNGGHVKGKQGDERDWRVRIQHGGKRRGI